MLALALLAGDVGVTGLAGFMPSELDLPGTDVV
jgi:hypothetical protein